MTLSQFLNNKTLYYDKIEYDTIKKSWEILAGNIQKPYIIHIVGTNGKGTTGRFLAYYLSQMGKQTLHYSSPHILRFNERIWINTDDASDDTLENAHQKLQTLLPPELTAKLTYFEYTTLMALYLSSGFDYLVFEAGLGGEFDATSVAPRELSLITTIDLDHQAFLGNCVEDIAATKLRSCHNDLIIGHQVHNAVYEVANTLFEKEKILHYDHTLEIPTFLDYPEYLQNNLRLSCKALEYLGFAVDFEKFKNVPIKGRFEKIAPNVTIDVGHNPLAAKQIKKTLGNKKIHLIYGSYKDKEYQKVLEILKENILCLYAVEISDEARIENVDTIIRCANHLGINTCKFEHIEPTNEYLVFGSFKVVEHFIRYYNPFNAQ